MLELSQATQQLVDITFHVRELKSPNTYILNTVKDVWHIGFYLAKKLNIQSNYFCISNDKKALF